MGKSPRKRQVPQKALDLSDSVLKDENTNISENVKKREMRPSRSKPIKSKTDESSSSSNDSDEDSSEDGTDRFEEKKGPSKNSRTLNKSIKKSKSGESSFSENEQISGNSKVKKTKGSKEESQDDGAKSKSPSKRGRKGKPEKNKSYIKSPDKPSDPGVEFSDQESEESSGGLPDIQSLCETLEKESEQDEATSVEESRRNPRIVIAIKSKPAPTKRKINELDKKKGKKAKSVQEIKEPKSLRKDSATTQEEDEESETDANDDSSKKDSAKGKKKAKRKFPCYKCNTVFYNTYDLFDHTCEGKRLKGFACEFCDKIYLKRSIYINHKIIHSNKKPYKCGLCKKKSSSQSNHLYHMKKFHPEANPFTCEFPPCTKSFMTRKEQMEHHKMHTKFICVYCDEAFDTKKTMVSHKRKEHEVFF
ncbi:uncharacterized protein TNIN_347621 [Trichonephila inaurata madagascariensis]|uniref:C2H2-type domain-containing protein n=1 Tax=Trichonephila inaurata madagascariensis TaxID=2747483 RepID=A0A8X7C9Z1_9ARAC|nr:uncharacterized protein TNIN_347621 [Trichonephila inaurata madagascariensis]